MDVTPAQEAGFNVRTKVHEYGGACLIFSSDTVYFSNFKYAHTTPPPPLSLQQMCSDFPCAELYYRQCRACLVRRMIMEFSLLLEGFS